MGWWACRNHLRQSWSPPIPVCSTAPSSSAVSGAARPSSGGCGLRLRFVVSAKGREGARRPAPSPDGSGRARNQSCYDKHADTHNAVQHSGAANGWNRRDRVEARGCVLRLPKLTTNRSINASDLNAATHPAAKISSMSNAGTSSVPRSLVVANLCITHSWPTPAAWRCSCTRRRGARG